MVSRLRFMKHPGKGLLMDRSEIIYLLESCEFFKGLNHDNLEEVAKLCTVEAHAAGDHIFRQGDRGEQIYIVAEGNVFLERSVDLGLRKGTATIGMLSKGKVFGCWSTLLNEEHTLMSSALCRKPTTVLAIRGPNLRKIMLKDNVLGFNVMERFCFLLRDRLKGAYEAMEEL
jgi:CRP/FNR family cyclic AMP-dependent transcriptional regulator